MQTLILKLQADVNSRKRPRAAVWQNLKFVALGALAIAAAFEIGARSVDSTAGWVARAETRDRLFAFGTRVDALEGELDLRDAQIERLERAAQLSSKYGIGADLAMAIEEIALAENVDPNLAFELVRVESRFNGRAISPVGALGYTQLMPATADIMSPGITRPEIFDRDTNLRLGFRFFRNLLDYYKGDVRLALLAYNRGPVTVDRLLEAGQDPGNGYATMVLGHD
jgi:soluble lytic murein transglycosylase-like protein